MLCHGKTSSVLTAGFGRIRDDEAGRVADRLEFGFVWLWNLGAVGTEKMLFRRSPLISHSHSHLNLIVQIPAHE